MRVSVADAKNKLPELIKAVEGGEEVTICRRGIPVVDLVATSASTGEKPKFGTLKGRIVIHDPEWWKPMAEDELEAFLEGRS
ncbi:MAG TPA: type II toxin-antitoxin system prevent-host-death family antitoxin [Candidatus Saccharimonadales bacterium]|jgi:prevent-host-death family protein|nr:type II toxin-antitoxin system prevent-host-death family antitoxin [Candidatus Saccharimonadales bacterium]